MRGFFTSLCSAAVGLDGGEGVALVELDLVPVGVGQGDVAGCV